jgi:hypothetical protein
VLVLNFVLSKAIIPQLVQDGATEHGSGMSTGFDNGKMIATVLYWVTRAAMVPSRAEGELETEAELGAESAQDQGGGERRAGAASQMALHPGDARVLSLLFDDNRQRHVLQELTRNGWLDFTRLKLTQIATMVWDSALQAHGHRRSVPEAV